MKFFSGKFIAMLVAVGFLAFLPGKALAIPSLQLDILGGTYDTVTQTIVSTDDTFTLYALLSPDDKAKLNDTYFLSAALVPQTGPTDSALGSFSIDGTVVTATTDMTYGVPPLDAYDLGTDPGDLASHGLFETFFWETAFTFDPNDTALAYNAQDNAGAGPTPDPNGTIYFAAFSLDASLLDAGFGLHFDLYNTKNGKNAVNDTDILSFAPFSHDAEFCCVQVPEPSSLLLLGTGLVALGLMRRRKI